MANNYEQGATVVPLDALDAGAKVACEINKRLQERLEENEGLPDAELEDFYLGGLTTELMPDGRLYLASGDEYFCMRSFEHIVNELAKRKLIKKSFSISVAWSCSRLRPDEFGGAYYRVLQTGEILWFSTNLNNLNDEQLSSLVSMRDHLSKEASL